MATKFFAIRCKSCGKYSGTQVKIIQEKIFTCTYCRKRLRIKKLNDYGLSTKVSGPYSSKEIPIAVAKLNERRITK